MNLLRQIGTAILAQQGFFSIDQLMKATKIERPYLRDVLAQLCQKKILKQITKNRKTHISGKVPTYSVIYHVMDRRKLAARIAPRLRKNTIQDRMWFILWTKFKNGGSFELRDLTVLAGAKRGMAHWYLQMLRRAGYITPTRAGGGRGVRWVLIKDPGCDRPGLDFSRKIRKGKKHNST